MLDLQVFSWIGKTIKTVTVIHYNINTINTISIDECFDNAYISDSVKTALSTHGSRNTWSIICVRTGQSCNQNSSNIHDGTLDKNS